MELNTIANTNRLRFLKESCIVAITLSALFLTTGNVKAQDLTNFRSQKPVSLSGGFETRGTFYGANGIAPRQAPYSYLINASATFSVYGLSIPFSATYSPADHSFNQPFNQFGISPTYKWITVHAGYRNIDYSPYTLGGHTILGGGIELNPGKLRAGFMYGKLNQATTVDTNTLALVPFSFSRTVIAGKLGIGSDRNFFELSGLRAQDDSMSVARNSVKAEQYIPPAQNTVLGYNMKFSFFKFVFETKGAASLYTRDVNSTLNIDDAGNDLLKKAKKYFTINGTSEIYSALNASLAYRANTFGLKVDYKRIDPEYKTMGSYFFDSDVEAWTFGPSLSLFKRKFRISGNIGFQHDNLLNQKRSTNKRVIGSGYASIDFTQSFAVDINYSNFSNDQMPNTVRFPDSLRIVQTTQNATVTPRYTIIKPGAIQVFSLSVSINKLSDYNQVITSTQSKSSTIDTKQYFFNYSVSFPKQGLGLFFNINRTDLNSAFINNTYQGVTLGGYGTFAKKLQLNLSNSFIQGIDVNGKSLIINSTAAISYKVGRNHQLKTAMYFTNNNPVPGSSQTQFSEFRNELSYILNF